LLSDLLRNNRLWSENRRRDDPDYFSRLAALQRPDYLWIGCSDSRVPANVITGLQPGEVFVHRNVANLVHRGDLNLLSVLEFAVDVLEVRHIIVCGHHGCGGVRAALEPHRHGVVDHWLQPIRDIADDAADALRDAPTPEARHDRLCELSVRVQVNNLARTPIMRAAWARGVEVSLHGWVYGLTDGLLHDLHCDVGPADADGADV
jgi:carbonic anhydrase